MLVNGIELAALDRIEEDLGGFLDTFEKAVVFGATSSGLLVRMVTEDLLAVSTLDLFFGCLVTIF